MLLRFSILFLACLLQFSSFAVNLNKADFCAEATQTKVGEHLLSLSDQSILLEDEKTHCVSFSILYQKLRTHYLPAVVSHAHYSYFFRQINRLITGLRIQSVPLFVLLLDLRN